MKFCDDINIKVIEGRPIFKGAEWPAEIVVDRNLLDFPQGAHVQFGRRGSLQFLCVNGQASYRRTEDAVSVSGCGWRYVRTDSRLSGGGAPPSAPAKVATPTPPAAVRMLRDKAGKPVEAFQWLPHAVPPVTLPEWFMRADFEHNKDGALTIRTLSGVAKAEPSDWIMSKEGKISVASAAQFAREFAVAA